MDSIKELVVKQEEGLVEYKPVDKQQPARTKGQKLSRNTFLAKLKEKAEFQKPTAKEIILDEDNYLENLEYIIRRDYFPGIQQNNSLGVEDDLQPFEKINEEYRRDFANKIKRDVDLNGLSVDDYVQNFASDELESLRDILHKDKEKRLVKYLWIYKQEYEHNEKLKEIKEYTQDYLALPQDSEKHFDKPNLLFNELYAKNSLFFDPVLSTKRNRSSNDEISDGLDGNILHEKSVLKENTRLPDNFIEDMMERHENARRKRIIDTYENSDVVKLMKEINQIDDKLRQDDKDIPATPMVNGYKLIKDPEPIPGKIDPQHIFTWGELDATPNILERKGFSIKQTPVREQIAESLVLKMSKRPNKEKDLQTFKSSNRSYQMTPSAVKLLNTVKRSQLNTQNIFDVNKTDTPLNTKGSTVILKQKSTLIRKTKDV